MVQERKNLIHIIPSNKWGGTQSYALDICRHYHEAGWQVTVLTRNAVGVDAPFADAGIELLHAPVAGFLDIASAMTLAAKLKQTSSLTVIHTHRYRDAFTALLAKKLAKRPGIKVVTTRHAVRRGRNTRIFRKMYSMVDAHIFVSRLAYDSFRHSLNGEIILPEKRVHILHNSLNVPDIIPSEEPTHGPIVALYQGSIVKGKGVEHLIDAMELLKGSKLRLRISGLGNPDYLDILRRRAMQRDVMDSIDWNIKTPPSSEACAEAHFGVVPSSEREAFSLESLRFMSAGRAQVTTCNGAQKEYLDNGRTALLVEPSDTQALADAMLKLAGDRDLRTAIGTEAYKEYKSHLSWSHFINTLNKIYIE